MYRIPLNPESPGDARRIASGTFPAAWATAEDDAEIAVINESGEVDHYRRFQRCSEKNPDGSNQVSTAGWLARATARKIQLP